MPRGLKIDWNTVGLGTKPDEEIASEIGVHPVSVSIQRNDRKIPKHYGKKSLKELRPDLSEEWDYEKNEKGPENYTLKSSKKVHWICKNNKDHIPWKAAICDRTNGNGCPYCSNKKVGKSNNLKTLNPDLCEEWDYEKNEKGPENYIPGSKKKVHWTCNKGHHWKATIGSRTKINGTGCPYCSGRNATKNNNLKILNSKLCEEWDFEKNEKGPENYTLFSNKKVWWICTNSHRWKATIDKRTNGRGCPYCSGRKVGKDNNLKVLRPDLCKEWNYEKNEKRPENYTIHSNKKVHWICIKGHTWEAAIYDHTNGKGCPYCSGRKPSKDNNLKVLNPELCEEWDFEKNEKGPENYTTGSSKKVHWICIKGHTWEARIADRKKGSGCPICNHGWTLIKIIEFLEDVLNSRNILTSEQIYHLSFIHKMGPNGKKMLQKFASLKALEDKEEYIKECKRNQENKSIDTLSENNNTNNEENTDNLISNEDISVQESVSNTSSDELHRIAHTGEILEGVENFFRYSDSEFATYLEDSFVARLWEHAYRDEDAAIAEAKAFNGSEYPTRIRDRFQREYEGSVTIETPKNYIFKYKPNLMQKHIAYLVKEKRRVGNWSGTGTGKTLSALLASQVIESRITIICCPAQVVRTWKEAIERSFNECEIHTKYDEPWTQDINRFLILSYGGFQSKKAFEKINCFLKNENEVDMIVVDEIHFVKQRYEVEFDGNTAQIEASESKLLSQRRQSVHYFINELSKKNNNLAVLGMSATPVINELKEGASLVEIIMSNREIEPMYTNKSVPNCLAMYRRLMNLGPRYKMQLNVEYEETKIPITISVEIMDKLYELRDTNWTVLGIEQILVDVRIPYILEHIKKGTIVYTDHVQDILPKIIRAIEGSGFSVGAYTGKDKTGIDDFLNEKIDVLVASRPITTGVDGLQDVCNRMIINELPWTAAEFEQLKGRILRQGQKNKVEVFLLMSEGPQRNGISWSYDRQKFARISDKADLASAAVDGYIPKHTLVSQHTAFEHLGKWLDALRSGEYITCDKILIDPLIPDVLTDDEEKRVAQYGDFRKMNMSWSQRSSESLHSILEQDDMEWRYYHDAYRKARESWTVIPYEEIIKWFDTRKGRVVGDFGCGEAQISEALKGSCEVHSFDHVAYRESVVACDMKNVPLSDKVLDVAIFSLSLMGKNWEEYLDEAYRTLHLDGWMLIAEPISSSKLSSNISNQLDRLNNFKDILHKKGFGRIETEVKGKFVIISCIKE
jgi:superfamily II DNA or RNA helicase